MTTAAEQSEKKPLEENKGRPAKPQMRDDASTLSSPFLLEDIFPDPVDLLQPNLLKNISGSDALVVIDTNALLLPYAVGKEDLGALADTYRALAERGRLFLPARSAREFIKNRDRKISDLLQTLSNLASRISVEGVVSPILEEVEGYDDLKEASAVLAEGRKAYLKAITRIRAGVTSWRGNDPVTSLYAEVFKTPNVVEHDGEREALQREWSERNFNKVPPGYKDGGKADTGIGDYLIWRTILRLGREHKKDLIFVTGEEKADWFVRSGGEPIFARPELLVEYRGASGGKNLHLSSLAELLRQFGAAATVVEEIRSAEASANSVVRMRTLVDARRGEADLASQGVTSGEVQFECSSRNGEIFIGSPNGGFTLIFSKASGSQVHLYRAPTMMAIMRLKSAVRDVPLDMDEYDASSHVYTIGKGEAFGALNTLGDVLIGRIVDITNDSRGASTDQVRFEYRIFQQGMPLTAP